MTIEDKTGRAASVSVAGAPHGPFSWQAFSVIVGHNDTHELDVTYHSASYAIVRGTLLVTSNTEGSPRTIGLIGKGPGGFLGPSQT